MAHRNLQAKSVRNSLLQPFLEMPGTVAMADTGVGQDQQFVTLVIMFLSTCTPPLPDVIDGKLWRVR